ncbi:hypothetical protein SAY87_020734 [Trapa incisa]|uniref:Uncharacterized protein n=1 Tax=Trapa incisa TaxID=236973 RepID=A0AAN7PPP0_9MYRT|nr:hypothetical protein SAY87_020734 [Trapa incisa]
MEGPQKRNGRFSFVHVASILVLLPWSSQASGGPCHGSPSPYIFIFLPLSPSVERLQQLLSNSFIHLKAVAGAEGFGAVLGVIDLSEIIHTNKLSISENNDERCVLSIGVEYWVLSIGVAEKGFPKLYVGVQY